MRGKTGTIREIQTADAAARNHPADGEINLERAVVRTLKVCLPMNLQLPDEAQHTQFVRDQSKTHAP